MARIATLTSPLQQMAEALLIRDELRLRLLVQAWLDELPCFDAVPRPQTRDRRVLTVAAALVELLAQRANQPPPPWTSTIGGLPEPFFVMRRAERPGFSRDLCLTESPSPLKQRNIFSPPDFLSMV